ncbi:MAG: hypothetical protein ACTSO9_00695 [Candidatus Helarchaeota archaeon]
MKRDKRENKLVLFFTENPNHEIDKKIIEEFEKRRIEIAIMDPNLDSSLLEQKYHSLKNDYNVGALVRPNYWNIFKICKLLDDNSIQSINRSEIMRFFKSRIEVEDSLKNLFESKSFEKFQNKIAMPRSWFAMSADNLSIEEEQLLKEELIKQFRTKIPLVVKYPINHTGFHFVRRIDSADNFDALMPLIKSSGIILQEYIETTGEILKCIKIGDKISSVIDCNFIEDFKMGNYNSYEEVLQNNLSNDSAKYRDRIKNKNNRKEVQTPKPIQKCLEFISEYYQIDIFGVDFLIKGKSEDPFYYLIDINDFPGCRGIKNAGKYIVDLCIKRFFQN